MYTYAFKTNLHSTGLKSSVNYSREMYIRKLYELCKVYDLERYLRVIRPMLLIQPLYGFSVDKRSNPQRLHNV